MIVIVHLVGGALPGECAAISRRRRRAEPILDGGGVDRGVEGCRSTSRSLRRPRTFEEVFALIFEVWRNVVRLQPRSVTPPSGIVP